ncbi:MAG: NAD(P)H-hydrate dehydratase [Quisquiliibacterium sp.]
MSSLLKVASIQALERRLLAGLPAGELMRRAAAAIANEVGRILRSMQPGRPVLALVGPGNNGADALLAALLLRERGYPCSAIGVSTHPPVSSDASAVWHRWKEHHLQIENIAALNGCLQRSPLVIDGLFGIGLRRPISGDAAQAIRSINAAALQVVAVDVPSGIDPDRGVILGGADGVAIRATGTVTMLADKPGLHTGEALDYVGKLVLEPLHDDSATQQADLLLFGQAQAGTLLGPRVRTSNKGSFGTVGIIGGSQGMQGAALLAARGAQAAGAGKVFIASPDVAAFDPGQPQLMTRALSDAFVGVDALCVGCGLGTTQSAARVLERALLSKFPVVLDADALNILGESSDLTDLLKNRPHPTVLTPHPLEAARLLGFTTSQIQADRLDAASQLAMKYQSCVLLKGAGSVLASADGKLSICDCGAPALASAGTGDVLAGVIASFLAQGKGAQQAALLGATVHGLSGEHWQRAHPCGTGLSAGELPELIRHTCNSISSHGRH